MVWHPGWPIEHPLVAEGRIAVLWPTATVTDFTALGEVHPDEFHFDMFTLGQETTEDNYRRWPAEHPLKEGTLPVILSVMDRQGFRLLRARRACSSTPLVLSLNLAMCGLTWYLSAMASALVPL